MLVSPIVGDTTVDGANQLKDFQKMADGTNRFVFS
jgi:hypothetical protein